MGRNGQGRTSLVLFPRPGIRQREEDGVPVRTTKDHTGRKKTLDSHIV